MHVIFCAIKKFASLFFVSIAGKSNFVHLDRLIEVETPGAPS